MVPPWHNPSILWVLYWEAASFLYIIHLSTDSYTRDQMTLGGGQRGCKQMFQSLLFLQETGGLQLQAE